jgi:hypothetical protein
MREEKKQPFIAEDLQPYNSKSYKQKWGLYWGLKAHKKSISHKLFSG